MRDSKEDGLCFSTSWITSGGKEVKDWRHDENLINRNIWSSINEYWIFNLGQKSVVDRQECVAAHAGAQFLCECWQVSISYHLHMPLTLPAIKTSQQHSTYAGEGRGAKNLCMSRLPPHVSLASHSFSQFSVCVQPSSAKWIWSTSSINLTKPRQKCWPTPRGVMFNFALHSQRGFTDKAAFRVSNRLSRNDFVLHKNNKL